MDHSQKALGLWLKAQLISMAIVGSLTGFGLWLIGVPSAIALGILAALLEFVPFAGPLLSGVIGVTIALMHSPQLALYAAGLYLVVQQIESYIIYPLVQQYAADIPALVLLFALIAFGVLFGIVGVIFAAPLTVVTFVLVKRLYVVEALHTATPIPGDDD
jgi:predicted PurR-regulated permease PerM